MKIAIYPGSFNPWHIGHEDVLKQALQIFDKIHIIQMTNPDKEPSVEIDSATLLEKYPNKLCFSFLSNRLLANLIAVESSTCIIKGLRNGQDLEYETSMKYWNEDLGLKIPTCYFICNRNLRHISSSAIRQVEKFKK